MDGCHRLTFGETMDRIRAALGPRGWIAEPRDQALNLVEARGLYRGAIILVIRPASTAEVAAVVRICAEAVADRAAEVGRPAPKRPEHRLGIHVRRDNAALSSGCKAHPAIRSRRKHPEEAWRRRNV
jgi:hypothetical protein